VWSRWRPLSRTNQVLAALALLLLAALPWYRLNLTASAPRGVWRLTRLPPVIERGMWVILPVPASVRSLVPKRYQTLLKQVAAVEGDLLCVEDNILWIVYGRGSARERHINYGLIEHERHGTPLPHLEEGCATVAAQAVFLSSGVTRALDSRYFGPVPTADLTALAFPLFTWE
jgi:type IV secretory pathway protease TraF